MLGLIVFLIALLIVVLLVKLLAQELAPGNPRVLQIALLVVLLLAILWLAGFGGWGHVYGWHFPRG